MNRLLLLIAALFAAIVSAQNLQTCVTSYDATVDYFPVKAPAPLYAKYFTISYNKNYKVVNNTNTKEAFVLTQCGTPTPDASQFPAGTKFFTIPVERAWTLDTTSITYIEVLGKLNTIKYVTYPDAITSPCTLRGLNQSTIQGRSGTTANYQSTTNIVAFGNYQADATNNITVSTSAVSDPGVRNIPEWAYFYSAFFNVEDVAIRVVNGILSNIDCFQSSVAGETFPTRKTIMFASPGYPSGYSISTAAYKRQLAEFAGATFYGANGEQTSFSDLNSFLEATKNVDILVDETYFSSTPTQAQVFGTWGITLANTTIKWVSNLFREDGIITPTYGLDWYTAATVLKDAVLADFIHMVNSSAPYPTYNPLWMRNVSDNKAYEIISASQCNDGYITDLSTNCTTYYRDPTRAGTTAGTASSTAGVTGSTAGVTGSTAGVTGSTAGVTAGTTSSTAGTTSSTAGTTSSTAGTSTGRTSTASISTAIASTTSGHSNSANAVSVAASLIFAMLSIVCFIL